MTAVEKPLLFIGFGPFLFTVYLFSPFTTFVHDLATQ